MTHVSQSVYVKNRKPFTAAFLGEPRTHAYDLLLELWAKLWQITLGWCQWKMQYQYTHVIKCSQYMSAGCQHVARLSSWTMPRPLNESQPYESGFFDRTDLLRHVIKRISSRRSWPYFLLLMEMSQRAGLPSFLLIFLIVSSEQW